MASMNLVSLLFLLLLSISLTTDASFCYKTGNFTANSTYETNRDLLFSSLASNVSSNGGFYTATAGQGADKVYGLALCRADASPQACASCAAAGTKNLASACPNQKEAISWDGDPPCIIRYSNRSFIGILETKPVDPGYNVDNITKIMSDVKQFDRIWGGFMDGLIAQASNGTRKLKFAAGQTDLIYYKKIYAIIQCTPDLSQRNCSDCLKQLVGYYNTCCHGHQGGFVQNPNCFFRWDLYPFFSIANSTSVSPPQLLPPSYKDHKCPRFVIIIVPTIVIFMALVLTCAIFHRREPKLDVKNLEGNNGEECLQYSFETIKLATNNFSDKNKLGQGGFGAVYKGELPYGKVIAVKRLSRNSKQGEVEFKNEVLLVARLQHRNLVRLLGFCMEGKEKLLIYEFLPNSSLDHFIFDPIKRELLNWEMRYKILEGIARGILYLHEESQLRIIHRDLKASNVLLDDHMNPKVSDFGMAKLFGLDQTQYITSKIAGTLGYMSPEYAMYGIFSVKSDVFSFGVLVLETITGQKISTFYGGEEEEDLLTYTWNNWKNERTHLNLVDSTLLRYASSLKDIERCIHIGLLCVQENVGSRPSMASVVLMLTSSSLVLPTPSRPAFFMNNSCKGSQKPALASDEVNPESPVSNKPRNGSSQSSVNQVSITELAPR